MHWTIVVMVMTWPKNHPYKHFFLVETWQGTYNLK
jgi:hypothetical protein